MVFFKCLTNFAISKHEIVVPIVPDWRCYDCSTVRLLQLLHGETVTIVPQWDCCNCSTVRPLWFFYNWTVTNVPQWHCYDCSTVALLRLLHGYTVTIVPQWHCYDCSTVTMLWLFPSKSFETEILWTVNFVPQWNSLLKNSNMYQEHDTWSVNLIKNYLKKLSQKKSYYFTGNHYHCQRVEQRQKIANVQIIWNMTETERKNNQQNWAKSLKLISSKVRSWTDT